MPVTVVVGGQFGSEGKGKVAHILSRYEKASLAVRIGSPNSGHTVYDDLKQKYVFKYLPTACIDGVNSIVPAGSVIKTKELLREISQCNSFEIQPFFFVDPRATVCAYYHSKWESKSGLIPRIGSTASGTGYALIQRMKRKNCDILAGNIAILQPYLYDTSQIITTMLKNNKRVIVEGSQGFGLDLYHSNHYPYVTSRSTTASAHIASVGISPLYVDRIVLVIRAFPIRVAGNSGPLPNEISWKVLSAESKKIDLVEYTSITHKIRRVARFDSDIVKKAIAHNNPTHIVLNHVDYACPNRTDNEIEKFVSFVENSIKRRIDYIGIDPFDILAR